MTTKTPDTDSLIAEVRGRALPLRGHEIDTDRIMPARYLRCVTFEGLEDHVFEDDRQQAGGTHPFDDPRFRGAGVLIVNRNFGCGSSREHAPQGLMRWGVRGMVGESFAEIFFGNCVSLGIPCFTLPAAEVEEIQRAVEADPGLKLLLDIRNLTVAMRGRGKQPEVFKAHLPQGARESFLGGTWDATGLLRREPEEIRRVAAALPYVRGFAAVDRPRSDPGVSGGRPGS